MSSRSKAFLPKDSVDKVSGRYSSEYRPLVVSWLT